MIYLSAEDLVAIHGEVSGAGVRDRSLIEAAAARPEQSAFGEDAYRGPWFKAAALLHALVATQPFFDGNKRTGWAACEAFLTMNGYPLLEGDAIVEECFVLALSTSSVDVSKAAEWLENYAAEHRTRLQFALLAGAAEFDAESGGGLWNGQRIGLTGLMPVELPALLDATLVFRVVWGRDDTHSDHTFSAAVESDSGDPEEPVAFITDWQAGSPTVGELPSAELVVHAPFRAGPHLALGINTGTYMIPLRIYIANEGRFFVSLSRNGSAMGRVPIIVGVVKVPPTF